MNNYFSSSLKLNAKSLAKYIADDIMKMLENKTLAESRRMQLFSLIELAIEDFAEQQEY